MAGTFGYARAVLPGFDERRKALENAFFSDQEQKLLDELRAENARRETRELLRERSGVDDDAVLDKLIELSIDTESVVAMSLVPLIRVAWADGSIHDKERNAVLESAAAGGVGKDTPAYALLDSWLAQKPDDALTVGTEGVLHEAHVEVAAVVGHHDRVGVVGDIPTPADLDPHDPLVAEDLEHVEQVAVTNGQCAGSSRCRSSG